MRPLLDRRGDWHLALFTLYGVAAGWRFAYLVRLRHTASLDADTLVLVGRWAALAVGIVLALFDDSRRALE